MNYYYNTTHAVPLRYYNGLRIVASSSNHEKGYLGLFHYNWDETAYIEIFNHGSYGHPLVIGNILHELGHFVHFKQREGAINFYNTRRLLQESYACYIGWYLCNRYYTSLGCNLNPSNDVTNNARQHWQYMSADPYSPLFVDLVDNYNQGASPASKHLTDEIRNVPASIIHTINSKSSDWPTCRSLLLEYADKYYKDPDQGKQPEGVMIPLRIPYTKVQLEKIFTYYDTYSALNPVDTWN